MSSWKSRWRNTQPGQYFTADSGIDGQTVELRERARVVRPRHAHSDAEPLIARAKASVFQWDVTTAEVADVCASAGVPPSLAVQGCYQIEEQAALQVIEVAEWHLHDEVASILCALV